MINSISLHDALPIWNYCTWMYCHGVPTQEIYQQMGHALKTQSKRSTYKGKPPADIYAVDRKSTRLNSSHVSKSYAVSCLKKKQHCQKPLCCYSGYCQ